MSFRQAGRAEREASLLFGDGQESIVRARRKKNVQIKPARRVKLRVGDRRQRVRNTAGKGKKGKRESNTERGKEPGTEDHRLVTTVTSPESRDRHQKKMGPTIEIPHRHRKRAVRDASKGGDTGGQISMDRHNQTQGNPCQVGRKAGVLRVK